MKPQPRYQRGERIGGRYLIHKALPCGMGEVYRYLDLEQNYLYIFQQRYFTTVQRFYRPFE